MTHTQSIIPQHILDRSTRLFNKLGSGTTQTEQQAIYEQILQMLVDSTHLTSAYLCKWEAAILQSVIIAEYISTDANYFECKSDVGIYYDEDPHSIVGRWVAKDDLDEKQINFYDLPPGDPDRLTYLKFGARSIYFSRIRVNSETWGYIELWESRYNHMFNLEQRAIYQYISQQFANYLSVSA